MHWTCRALTVIAARVVCREWIEVAGPPVLGAAVSRCIQCYEDDCEPALTALGWLDCGPTWHPDTPGLLQACIAHSARAVRQAAWLLLAKHEGALRARWPSALDHLCTQAAQRAAEEAASAVYDDADDLADLRGEAMAEHDEPDCCE